MTVSQQKRQVATMAIAAGSTAYADLPRTGFLGALDFHISCSVTDASAAAITVVDATLGPIPIISNIQLNLNGVKIPLNISGRFLDYWSHIDRPGSERLVDTSTVSGDTWHAVIRYEIAQSIGNLTGVIPLHALSSARLEVQFAAVGAIATSANATTIAGNVNVYAETYASNRPVSVDTALMHSLRVITADIVNTGETNIELPSGRQLLRLIVIAENNALYSWTMMDRLKFQMGPGDTPYDFATEIFRAQQLRTYGGDDIPITGVYTYDFRQAGGRDVVPLGDPDMAPDPELIASVPSTATLTNGRLHMILEELSPVGG